MRAKFINEIKQNVNKSGLGVIDIGRNVVIRGYDYIIGHWHYLDNMFIKRHIINEISITTEMDTSFVEDSINHISKIFGCNIEDIAIVHMKIMAMHAVTAWINRILNDRDKTVKERITSATSWCKINASPIWNVGSISYTLEEIIGKRSTISKYYFIRYK